MPYSVGRRGDQWCVLGPDDKPIDGGCHDSREDALAHQRALAVNVQEAQRAALADAFPLDPPLEWFTSVPDWFEPNMKLTVVTEGPEAGRVAGTVASRGVCILNGTGRCWSPTDSPTGYAEAMQGDTPTADGFIVKTANLSAEVNHVPLDETYGVAVDVMAHTGTQLARVRYMDVPGYGTVALGAAWPGLTDQQVRKMQASALSGDWRWRDELGVWDMAGAIFVNSPGLPLPARPVFAARAASLTDPHSPIYGLWISEEEATVAPPNSTGSVVVTCGTCGGLITAPARTAAGGVVTVSAPAAPCGCGTHTAAPVPGADAPPMEDQGNTPSEAGQAVTREEFDALAATVQAIVDQLVGDQVAALDAVAAALPEPFKPKAEGDDEEQDPAKKKAPVGA